MTTSDNEPELPTYITREEAAVTAGCSERTINRWLAAGKLTRHVAQPGSLLRIELGELDRFLRTQPIMPELITEQVE
jgi:excisionase family DNA binding protein